MLFFGKGSIQYLKSSIILCLSAKSIVYNWRSLLIKTLFYQWILKILNNILSPLLTWNECLFFILWEFYLMVTCNLVVYNIFGLGLVYVYLRPGLLEYKLLSCVQKEYSSDRLLYMKKKTIHILFGLIFYNKYCYLHKFFF